MCHSLLGVSSFCFNTMVCLVHQHVNVLTPSRRVSFVLHKKRLLVNFWHCVSGICPCLIGPVLKQFDIILYLAVPQQFPVDHRVLLLPQISLSPPSSLAPISLYIVLYHVFFTRFVSPNLHSFVLLPNRALCLIISPPAFQPCFILTR